jgi:hypothetical protein
LRHGEGSPCADLHRLELRFAATRVAEPQAAIANLGHGSENISELFREHFKTLFRWAGQYPLPVR